MFITGQKLLLLRVLSRAVGDVSFHLQIELILSCCAASVDPRMVQEAFPASCRKVGIESQQSFGEEGLLGVFSPAVCSGLCPVSLEHPEGWRDPQDLRRGSQPGLHSLAQEGWNPRI